MVGRTVRLNGASVTVIGVMPKRFMWRGADVSLPVTFERGHVGLPAPFLVLELLERP